MSGIPLAAAEFQQQQQQQQQCELHSELQSDGKRVATSGSASF